MLVRRQIASWLFALACASAASAAPRIEHAGLECIAPGRFAVVLSGIDPGDEIQTAKVYFRSSLYPDFYFVEMKREGETFVGILPQVSTETPQVIYYVEALDAFFESGRTAEFDPAVQECDDDPAAAYFNGTDPQIIVGATKEGVSAIPPGFSAAGIVGIVTAAGVSSGIGGGVSAGVAVAAAAGAAGVAAGAVAVSGSTPEPSTTSVAAAPPPAVTTSTAPVSVPPTTVPPTTVPTTTVATTTVVPTSTTTVTTSTTSSSTTSSPNTTTSEPALNVGCFTVQVLEECKIRVNAACVVGPVDRYHWVLDTEDRFQRIDLPDGPVNFVQEWDEDDCEHDANIIVQLTVHKGSVSATSSKTVFVQGEDDLRTMAGADPVELRIGTRLEAASGDGRASGRLLLDRNLVGMVAGADPTSFRARLSPGVHEIEGLLVQGDGEPGEWSFELSGEGRLVPGSLRVLDGNLLTRGPHSLAFRLSGAPGERVRFQLEIRR